MVNLICCNVSLVGTHVISDIQLNVKGMKNLYESFMDYVAVETLEGENKYQAEGLGLQDAKKGIIFESFPPVLHLQLKRFEYDIQRDAMVKVRTFFPSLSSFRDSQVLIIYSRSTIVTNSLLRSISASFSMTTLIDQSHGCTNCTVYWCTQVICTVGTTLHSSNLIGRRDGSSSTTTASRL